jgi:uncharacterized membrane-anchored protein YhcB (DUF1043 family)
MGIGMTWQEPVVVFIVGAAVGYLVWKLGLSGPPRKKKGGPDVSLKRVKRSGKKKR